MDIVINNCLEKLDPRIDVYFQNQYDFDEEILQMCFREMYKDAMNSKRIYVEAADCCNDREDE